jgi:hypothetical protein
MMDAVAVGAVEIISGLVLLVAGFFISMKLGA